MKGHDAIIKARMAGQTVSSIWISDAPPVQFGDVQVEPKDNPELLDWRFVKSLMVHVTGRDEAMVAAIVNKCSQEASGVFWGVYRQRGDDLIEVISAGSVESGGSIKERFGV